MKPLRCQIALLCLCFLNPSILLGGTYYVATTGNDAGSGSFSSPYRTIQHALDNASATDTIYVRGGTYQEQIVFNTQGSAENGYLTLSAYGGEAPTIDGSAVTSSAPEGLINIDSKSYLKIIGFTLSGLSAVQAGHTPAGIWISGTSSHIEIKNNLIQTISTGFSGGNAHGIAVYGDDSSQSIQHILINGNEIRNCTLGSSEALVLNGNVEYFTISNNTIHDNDNIGIDFIGHERVCADPAKDRARNGTCRANLVYNIDTATNPAYGGERSAAGIYVDGGTQIIIEQNTVHTCNIGIEIASEHQGKDTSYITVRNNFVYHNDIMGIALGGYDTQRGSTVHCLFVNNTLYQNDTRSDGNGELCLQYDTQNNTFKNNIFFCGSQNLFVSNAYTSNSGNILDFNLYYGPGGQNGSEWQWQNQSYDTFSAWQTETGNDANSSFADPRLVNAASGDLHLSSDSPAINAGTNLSTAVSGDTDIDGDPRLVNQTIDQGADEATNVHLGCLSAIFSLLI